MLNGDYKLALPPISLIKPKLSYLLLLRLWKQRFRDLINRFSMIVVFWVAGGAVYISRVIYTIA